MRVLTLMLLAACAPVEPTEPAPEVMTTAEVSSDSGGACMTGCAVEPAGPLSDGEIASLLAKVAVEPYGAPTIALETLLFHTDATRAYLAVHGTNPLDPERGRLLRRELSRTHAIVSMRLVDAHGVVRARVDESRVPLGKKEHIAFKDYVRLQPFEASGTVTRVGLGHIWTRY